MNAISPMNHAPTLAPILPAAMNALVPVATCLWVAAFAETLTNVPTINTIVCPVKTAPTRKGVFSVSILVLLV